MTSMDEIVRLSHTELIQMSREVSQSSVVSIVTKDDDRSSAVAIGNENDEKETRRLLSKKASRPERAVYTPGQTRLTRTAAAVNDLQLDRDKVSSTVRDKSAIVNTGDFDVSRCADIAGANHKGLKTQTQDELVAICVSQRTLALPELHCPTNNNLGIKQQESSLNSKELVLENDGNMQRDTTKHIGSNIGDRNQCTKATRCRRSMLSHKTESTADCTSISGQASIVLDSEDSSKRQLAYCDNNSEHRLQINDLKLSSKAIDTQCPSSEPSMPHHKQSMENEDRESSKPVAAKQRDRKPDRAIYTPKIRQQGSASVTLDNSTLSTSSQSLTPVDFSMEPRQGTEHRKASQRELPQKFRNQYQKDSTVVNNNAGCMNTGVSAISSKEILETENKRQHSVSLASNNEGNLKSESSTRTVASASGRPPNKGGNTDTHRRTSDDKSTNNLGREQAAANAADFEKKQNIQGRTNIHDRTQIRNSDTKEQRPSKQIQNFSNKSRGIDYSNRDSKDNKRPGDSQRNAGQVHSRSTANSDPDPSSDPVRQHSNTLRGKSVETDRVLSDQDEDWSDEEHELSDSAAGVKQLEVLKKKKRSSKRHKRKHKNKSIIPLASDDKYESDRIFLMESSSQPDRSSLRQESNQAHAGKQDTYQQSSKCSDASVELNIADDDSYDDDTCVETFKGLVITATSRSSVTKGHENRGGSSSQHSQYSTHNNNRSEVLTNRRSGSSLTHASSARRPSNGVPSSVSREQDRRPQQTLNKNLGSNSNLRDRCNDLQPRDNYSQRQTRSPRPDDNKYLHESFSGRANNMLMHGAARENRHGDDDNDHYIRARHRSSSTSGQSSTNYDAPDGKWRSNSGTCSPLMVKDDETSCKSGLSSKVTDTKDKKPQRSWAEQCEEEEEEEEAKAAVRGVIRLPAGSCVSKDPQENEPITLSPGNETSEPRKTLLPSPRDYMDYHRRDIEDHRGIGSRESPRRDSDAAGVTETEYNQVYDGSNRRGGRGTSHRTLWDPSKPAPARIVREASPPSSAVSPRSRLGAQDTRDLLRGRSITASHTYNDTEYPSLASSDNRLDSLNITSGRPGGGDFIHGISDYGLINESDRYKRERRDSSDSSSATTGPNFSGLYHPSEYRPHASHAYPYQASATAYMQCAPRVPFPGSTIRLSYPPGFSSPRNVGHRGGYEADYHGFEQTLAGGHYPRNAVPAGGSRSAELTGKVDMLMREAGFIETQLFNLISRRSHGSEGMSRFLKLRADLQNKLEEVVLLDLDLSNQFNVEQTLWRSAFYQVIEMLRHRSSDTDEDGMSKKYLLTLIEEGVSFYETLLRQLQTLHGFNVDEYTDTDQATLNADRRIGRGVKLALISCQRIMICLGDLARYREQAHQTMNYGRARSWYMKAQQIAPKNGRPYNQLAILAVYTCRKLDAVYYYMRSLAASNPFLTARESLMSLFDEASKKASRAAKLRRVELTRMKHALAAQRQSRTAERSSDHGRGSGQRVEIWISSDGTSSDRRPFGDEEDDGLGFESELRGLPKLELNKRFLLSFLNVHGKLFTKIGMETFAECVGHLLSELRILISHSPSPLTRERLLQLMAINMFSVENITASAAAISTTGEVAHGIVGSVNSKYRFVIQEEAVQLSLNTFALLAERCTCLLRNHSKQTKLHADFDVAAGSTSSPSSDGGTLPVSPFSPSSLPLMNEDLHQLLPSVKVWTDWMMCHVELWNPLPLPLDPCSGPILDVFKIVADLINELSRINISRVELHSSATDGCIGIVLPEDTFLAGFVPLLALSVAPCYVASDIEKELARDCVRVSKLLTFADFLCGIEPPVLSYVVETRSYISVVVAPAEGEGLKGQNKNAVETAMQLNDDVIIESEEDVCDLSEDDDEDERHEIVLLKARKQELSKRIAEQTLKQESIKAALEGGVNGATNDGRIVELEIRPSFIVADTNCFIDHLRAIRLMLTTGQYTLILPLIVINELDYLSRGAKDGRSYSEHSDMVRSAATAAVEFLEAGFEAHNRRMRAITSRGTTLDTISFRSEEKEPDTGNNDDQILSCCLHYCHDKARDFMPKSSDEPIRLQRDIVLLTNDRNLRLKAHLHNVPVKDVPSFLRWANIS